MLLLTAQFLDLADRAFVQVVAHHGGPPHHPGDQVQRDVRAMAWWAHEHPDAAAGLWAHVQAVREQG